MAVVTITSEGLAKLVFAALQDELATELDAVEAYWASPDSSLVADPITLDDPEHWEFGYRVSLLEPERQWDDFPVVVVMEGDEAQEPELCAAWNPPHGEGRFIIFIGYYVVDIDQETCSKKRARYTQAIKRVMENHSNLMGCNSLTYQPRVELTPFIRLVDLDDDLQRPDYRYYGQGALITTVWAF
jgi:hypothetical protein